ncbi:MAG: glycosyltransferase family 2 protein, partial [Candidatus Saccharibacteria bacterium]
MAAKLSICLVVKNEERFLQSCLNSIAGIADEIIIVDTGSTDRTIEIAKQYTDEVFFLEWNDDFSDARNFGLERASGEWIFVIDGDEELDPSTAQNLKIRMNQEDAEGFLVKVINYYNAGDQVQTVTDVIFRLFRNRLEYRYSGAIHEQISENIQKVNPHANFYIAEDICLIHYGYLNETLNAKNKTQRN